MKSFTLISFHDTLAFLLYWQLALLGGVVVTDNGNPIYQTFGALVPVAATGCVFFAAAHLLIFSYWRQQGRPFVEPNGELIYGTRLLFSAGILAGLCFTFAAVAFFVHSGFQITTAQAMYAPSAIASFIVASEGRPLWT